jgi:hypothetical protein
LEILYALAKMKLYHVIWLFCSPQTKKVDRTSKQRILMGKLISKPKNLPFVDTD